MADHVREQIAVAVLAAVTGLSTTASRVYRDRDTDARPLQASELPGLVLLDEGDPGEIVSLGNRFLLERTLSLQLVAHVKAASGYGTTLNQILKEIEMSLAAASLGGAKYARPSQIGAREISESADLPVARQVFTFELVYYTQNGVPDVAL